MHESLQNSATSRGIRVTVRCGRSASRWWRSRCRFGLRLITVGASVGLGYVAAKLVAVAAGALWPGSALITDAVVVTSFTIAILLILIGATIPSWGPRIGLDRLWFWVAALRDCYRLHPLWTAIHEVVPEIALLPAPPGIRGHTAFAQESSLRRVRMTVEILDGYATLLPWISGKVFRQAQTAAQEAGLTGDRLAATTEAAVIAAALTYRHRGWPVPEDADEVPMLPIDGRPTDPVRGDHSGAAEQVAWLTQVARAYRSSAVAAVLAQLAPPTPAAVRER
ncbi:MAG TPA: MAB_1171c family putative transporter [Micromonospora sp.]|nr:MAB_1171c family putative transporter [Micromonospora sp.]